MFIKLTHGLHAVLNAIVSYIQNWTDDSVPDGTKTLHNFKDGQGKRPAVPEDNTTSSTNIIGVKTDNKYGYDSDSISNSENVLKVELKTELANGSDSVASKSGITNTVCVPEPIIFEISNEVPDKIEKVVPVKTQALPGQDFIFQILYVKDYNYIEGDILPVFGTWGNYARLSRDGKYLTVNSNADLSVRLILTPAPQDWIPEKPDPSIIQQQGDRMLNTIPRDGAKADYTVEEMKIEDYIYTVSIENQASTFVTNSEFNNGKYYTVKADTNKITIPMTFAEGFDENAIYWKCYDDPKSETPVTGYYPTTDYNEEYNVPNGFRKLQYIYTNDNAYIDLGFKLKKDYKVKVLMNVEDRTDTSYVGMFGARNSKDTQFNYQDGHTNGAYACYSKYCYRSIGIQRNNRNYFGYVHDENNGAIRWYYSNGVYFECRNYDGTLLRRYSASASDNIDTNWNCYLFTVNDMGTPYQYGTKGKFYRCEVWDENDNLIMRLIPAKNLATGSCGLYDIVNNKFYYNQRPMASFSGPEFYVWQKPMQCSDHNAVMYLEENNDVDFNKDYDVPSDYVKVYEIYSKESRVNTGYKIKKDDRVECCATVDNNTNASYRVLFGARQSSFSADNFFFFVRFNGQNVACYGKNAKETKGTTMTYGIPCKFIAEPYSLSCYDTKNNLNWKIDVDGGTPTDSVYNCWIGCGNNSNSNDSWCYAHYHYFRVYDKNNNLVVNLIPVKRLSDSTLGFYDTVRKTFYTRNTGNYNYEYRDLYLGEKRILHIENIHKDINFGIIRNPVYDNPFKLEEVIEDEKYNEPIDSLTHNYEITDSKIMDYFYVVSTTNQATDYVSVDASYRAANLGNSASFTLTYKAGYDNYDISCTPDTTAKVTVNKAHYITYNELDIPADYTPVKGLKNTNQSMTFINTKYIPKWNDKVVCYASILRDSYYTYPCYVFGTRTAVNNKSFVFYAHRSSGDNCYRMGYDRCCGEKDIREIVNNELMKITADNNGCECDYAYMKTKINTEMYKIPIVPDYNTDVTLPTTYEKLGCIENKGNVYVNLGFKLKANDAVEIYTNLSTGSDQYETLFGARQTDDVGEYCLWTRYDYGNICYGRNGNYKASINVQYNTDIKIFTNKSKFGWYDSDGILLQEFTSTNATLVDTSYNCYLFARNTQNSVSGGGYCKAKVYGMRIYNENGELIHHFVPARQKSNGAIGLYDVITNAFVGGTNGTLSYNYVNYTGYDDCSYEMYLFNCNHSNNKQYSFYGSIYKFIVYDGEGNLIVNLVPVKRISDNVLGFYDTIRKIFVTVENGTLIEATEPTYKSSMVVSDIPSDTYVTITKNNNARKNIALEEGIEDDVFHQKTDQLEYNYELKNTSIIDWFNTVKCINDANLRCTITGAVATYYNVPRIGDTTRFPVTYNVGLDDDMIEATANNGATVEIKPAMKIVYDNVPDEYIKLYGLYNNSTSTYFEIPYNIKATDSIKLFVKDDKNSYTYFIFGADYYNNTTTTSRVLCSRYTSNNNDMYYHSGNKIVYISGPKDEVLEIDCKPSEISYTNGYNDYNYTLDNTPANCTGPLHVFGTRYLNSGHGGSFYGTIYKFTIYDSAGVKINLIPVKRKVDGALGFYDTVQDQFYLPNSSGSVSPARAPSLKGKIIVSNITTDTDLIVSEKQQPAANIVDTDSFEHLYSIENCSITDYWHYLDVNNTTNGEVTFTGMVYGTCYTCKTGEDITLTCTYKAGRSSTDFIVSDGTLTNNGIVLTNVKEDKKITIMLNDYHDPKSDTADDLNIFTNPDFSGYNQYRVVEGTDLMLTSYTYINSQVAAMSDKQIFEFNTNDLDILAFNPSNIPGSSVKSKIVTTDSNMNEVVQNVTINGKQMYKHTVTLRNQIKLETGKVYIFKVRDNTDTGKLIAYAKDTGPVNLVNSNYEYTVTEDGVYFNWNEANKYIVQGNKTIYFELNGIKL